METNKQAVVILLKTTNDEILAVSRKNNPNDFGLPGGKVESNETLIEAAKRELFEETGFEVKDEDFIRIFTAMDGEFLVTTFMVNSIYDSNNTLSLIKTNESGVVKFVSREILKHGSFGEYNKKLFDVENKLYNLFEICIFCKADMEWEGYCYRCPKCNSWLYDNFSFGVSYGDYFYIIQWHLAEAILAYDEAVKVIKKWKIESFDDVLKFKKQAEEILLFS